MPPVDRPVLDNPLQARPGAWPVVRAVQADRADVLQPRQQLEPQQFGKRESDHAGTVGVGVVGLDLRVGAVPQQTLDHCRNLRGGTALELGIDADPAALDMPVDHHPVAAVAGVELRRQVRFPRPEPLGVAGGSGGLSPPSPVAGLERRVDHPPDRAPQVLPGDVGGAHPAQRALVFLVLPGASTSPPSTRRAMRSTSPSPLRTGVRLWSTRPGPGSSSASTSRRWSSPRWRRSCVRATSRWSARRSTPTGPSNCLTGRSFRRRWGPTWWRSACARRARAQSSTRSPSAGSWRTSCEALPRRLTPGTRRTRAWSSIRRRASRR